MRNRTRRRHAFTIVELLVVIAIIGVLVGLLLPALSGVQRRSRKADESSRLRQVGLAWTLYANGNDNRALPGFLPESVQTKWKVKYRFPGNVIDETGSSTGTQTVPTGEAEEWPLRLLPYLDHDIDTLMGHLNLDETSPLSLSDYSLVDRFQPIRDPAGRPIDFRQSPTPGNLRIRRPNHVAEQPGFAYNAYYVGGWMEFDIVRQVALPRFWDARVLQTDADVRVNPVAMSPGTISDPSRMLLFCTASPFGVGGQDTEVNTIYPGSHYAVPPFLGEQRIWQRGNADILINVQTLLDDNSSPIPIGRFTGQTGVLHADLHTQAYLPGVLDDQRFWISDASRETWRHTGSP